MISTATLFDRASGEELDYIGRNFGVLRQVGEADDLYRRRLQLNQSLILGHTRSSLEEALEVERQRANDLELASRRWKETAARHEALHAEALDKIDFWRRRSRGLEEARDDLSEKMCDAIELREELVARIEWLEGTILGGG